MGICPYCNAEVRIADFFENRKIVGAKYKGEKIILNGNGTVYMFTCPNCDKILGFCR